MLNGSDSTECFGLTEVPVSLCVYWVNKDFNNCNSPLNTERLLNDSMISLINHYINILSQCV